MEAKFQIFLILLAVLAGIALLARRLNVAPSILLLLAGIALALRAGPADDRAAAGTGAAGGPAAADLFGQRRHELARIQLQPAADHAAAFGCVIFTTCAVAAATHYLLGCRGASASCSAPSSRRPTWWRRWRSPASSACRAASWSILEGEGLANDATALILYRFAVAAISTGVFSLPKAAGTFALDRRRRDRCSASRVGWLSLRLRHWARDPQVEITLSLMTPYLAYWMPEHLGGSGVLATVACGLYVSWNGPLLISSATRLQGIFFWDLVIYLIEGLLFLLTGLQMRVAVREVARRFRSATS